MQDGKIDLKATLLKDNLHPISIMTGPYNLRNMRVSEMRAIAKNFGLRWYTGLSKENLADFIENSISNRNSIQNDKWIDYSRLYVSEMREIAREKGLRGWSSLTKDKMVKFLNDNLNPPSRIPNTKPPINDQSVNERAMFMLKHGFTLDEVFRELDLETLSLDISKSDIESAPEIGCGGLCNNNSLCDLCKNSFLTLYHEVIKTTT